MSANDTDDGKSDGCIDYTDPETLRRLYWDENLSTRDIAKRGGVHKDTIRRWMDKHDIPTRERTEAATAKRRKEYTGISMASGGHYQWCQWDRKTETFETVRVHRLLAVAEYGLDAVADVDVHHKNNIPWDNRPDNLELLDRSEHTSHHKPWEDSPIIP